MLLSLLYQIDCKKCNRKCNSIHATIDFMTDNNAENIYY